MGTVLVVGGTQRMRRQIKRHLDVDLPVLHPVQVVDASLRGTNPFA